MTREIFAEHIVVSTANSQHKRVVCTVLRRVLFHIQDSNLLLLSEAQCHSAVHSAVEISFLRPSSNYTEKAL